MPIDPNLKLIPLSHETVDDYVRLRIVAFRDTLNRIVFNPDGPSAATIAGMAERVAGFVDSQCPCFLVQDTSTSAIIGAVKWRLVGHPQPDGTVTGITETELDEELKHPPKWLESDQDMWDKFYGCLNGTTREVMDTRPYWILDLLVVDPAHERRGAGSLMVKWGCDKADSQGVVAYVEASPEGTPMYAKLGYETVRSVTFDPVKEVGRDVGYVYNLNVMIREPRGKKDGGEGGQ